MPNVNLVVGNDADTTLQETAGKDLIYGYDPNGPQSQASTIAATLLATNFTQPVVVGAPKAGLPAGGSVNKLRLDLFDAERIVSGSQGLTYGSSASAHTGLNGSVHADP